MAKDPDKTSRFALSPQLAAGLILVVLAAVFVVENGKRASILFIAGPRVHTYLWLALLIAAALGFVGGVLVTRRQSRK
jgi:uncharacterized integral membrane protein